MGMKERISGRILFLIAAVLAAAGCMNQPLPPENASLSVRFHLPDRPTSEGIEVILPGTAYRGYTDREGRVVFDSLPPRSYEILVDAKDYQTYRETNITLEAGDHLFLGEITLVPRKTDGEILGAVKVEGEPTATVEVLLLGSNQSVKSASDGRYHFASVPVGKYQVTFYHPGAVAEPPIDVTIEAGAQTQIQEVVLKKSEEASPKAGAVRGKVALEGETDFSGVGVFVSGTAKFAETESDGAYWIEGIPVGEHDLVFELEGFRREKIEGIQIAEGVITQATDTVLFAEKTPSPIAANPPAVNGGDRLVDPSEPGILAGFAFYPDRADHSGIVIRLLDPPLETLTDVSGAYLIEGVPPGAREVRAEAEGYAADSLVGIAVEPGSVARAPQMNLTFAMEDPPIPGSARVYGQVLDRNRQPLSGVSVVMEQTALSAITGRDGAFLLDPVPLGDYTVLFTREGYQEAVANVVVEDYVDVPIPIVTLQPVVEYLEVIDSEPGNGARGVEVSDRVEVFLQFSENLAKSTIASNIRVFPTVESRVELVDVDTVMVRLLRSRGSGVQFDTDYVITVGTGLESTRKTRLEGPYELRFRTGGPRVLGSIPASGERGVLLAIDEPVILQFNTPVNMQDLKRITVRPNTGEIYNFIPQHVPYGHRVEMQMQLQPSRDYEITIPRTVRTQDGKRYENTPYRIRFKSGSFDDLTSPDQTEQFLGESGDPFGP